MINLVQNYYEFSITTFFSSFETFEMDALTKWPLESHFFILFNFASKSCFSILSLNVIILGDFFLSLANPIKQSSKALNFHPVCN